MTPENPRIEREPTHRVNITFYGIDHGSYNLQGLEGLEQALAEHLVVSTGTNMVFLEEVDLPAKDRRFQLKRARELGGFTRMSVDAQLYREFGRMKAYQLVGGHYVSRDSAIDKRIKTISESTIDEIIENKLLDVPMIRQFYQFQLIDRFAKAYKLSVDWEQHESRERTKLISGAKAFGELSDLTLFAMRKGDFEKAIDLHGKCNFLLQELNTKRDIDVVEDLKKRVKKSLKIDGGSVFIVFGALHHNIVDQLDRKLKEPHVSFRKKLFDDDLLDYYPQDKECVGRQAARVFILDTLSYDARDSRIVDHFAMNYENTQRDIKKFVDSTNFEELTSLINSKRLIEAFVRYDN